MAKPSLIRFARSFFPVEIRDAVHGDTPPYNKPAGYETVRYPLSGLVGTDAERAATAVHNAKYPDYDTNVRLLNQNITNWLKGTISVDGNSVGGLVHQKYLQCLNAPNYTLFSNTTSAGAHNKDNPHGIPIVPLESPHNSIHLAIGGFDVPGQLDASPIEGANGDMGENDTAGLDPIFYFHHCFIDYVFWTWQRRYDSTETLAIDSTDPGAGYATAGPPPAGRQPDERLDVNSTLNPFKTTNGAAISSSDVTDIAKLGYSYGPGSLDQYAMPASNADLDADRAPATSPSVHIEGLDRSKLRGSFVISAFARVDGKMKAIGHEAVLSRWQVEGCANCMAHLNAGADFALPTNAAKSADAVQIHVTTRAAMLHSRVGGAFAAASPPSSPALKIEIR